MKQVDSHAFFLSLRGGQFSDEVELEDEAEDDEVDEVELLLFALMEWERGLPTFECVFVLREASASAFAELPRNSCCKPLYESLRSELSVLC